MFDVLIWNTDKYADRSKYPLVPFSKDNTILGNMAQSEVTFVTWLYATVSLRDARQGYFVTKEAYWCM
jgi:hypothetical protein